MIFIQDNLGKGIDLYVNKEDVNRAVQKCKRGPSP